MVRTLKCSQTRAGELPHVVISKKAVQDVRANIAPADGNEACGFLMGHRTQSVFYVEGVRPAANIYQAKMSFAISHENYIAAVSNTSAEKRIVGIYHTHTNAAHPTHQDRLSMALYPFVWLIVGAVGSDQYEWKCFMASSGKVKELRLSMGD